MADIKSIILNSADETLEKALAPFIEEQFPTFVRTDYRKLVLFIKSYYEWMDLVGNPGYVNQHLDAVYDADKNLEQFFSHFNSTYLDGFPKELATNTSENKPNKKTLLKKIRDFYGNKGTESSYKFLFRVLYDSDLELYYPKSDILKTSDGQWIEPVSIKISSFNGSNLFSAKGGQIIQISGTGEVRGSADIDSVVQYTQDGIAITELFLHNLVGTFLPNEEVRITTTSGQEYRETPHSVLGDFYIEVPGEGYRIGDIVSVSAIASKIYVDSQQGSGSEAETEPDPENASDSESPRLLDVGGIGFSARVEQVGFAGNIKRISIINSGLNYGADIIVNIFSPTGKKQAVVYALRTAVTRYPGYFKGNSGKVSSNKKIQDGNYYQEFSYELKSRVGIDQYFDILKRLVHPVGMQMFGSVLLKSEIDNLLTSSTQFTKFETPVIGRYTPYTPRTFNNLRSSYFLPNQVKGATLQVWLSGYNIRGNTSDGITAGWGYVLQRATIGSNPGGRTATAEDIFGINRWISVVGGHTFSHNPTLPNSTVWLTPNFKREAINTHPSVNFRPVQYNFSGPSDFSALRSLGLSGPSMGGLGLTLSTSYFAVAKPRRLTTMNNFGSSTTGNKLIGDRGEHRGILFGLTGADLTVPKVAAFTWRTNNLISGIVGSIGTTGEWKLISHTLTCGAGNSGPMSLFVDGVCLGTVSEAHATASAIATQPLQIGMNSWDSLVGAFDGEIAEVLCYQGDVGVADRQKIEGYLAHKYNLDGNLPNTHPHKTTPPGASLPAGGWSGATGDFYPIGYNPYIGSTTEVGPNGRTAALGSLFYSTNLGYTYTVMDEFGLTAHNSIGAPLGSTTAWRRNKETVLEPNHFPGLVLWLKPENIGVCGSVVTGACLDIWRDASPEENHGLPPTWDKWNSVATITHNATTTNAWGRQAYDSVHPVTKIAFRFNGVCGGFTTGRLIMVGLNTASYVATGSYYPGNWVYSYGPYSTAVSEPRNVYYINYDSSANNEHINESSSTMNGFDNSVFEMEYVEPNLIWRKDGVVKRQKYVGYGQTFYMDSTFYFDAANISGHSVTLLEMAYKGNPVVPTFTTSAGVNAVSYAGITIDKLRPTLVVNDNSTTGATAIQFSVGVLYSPDTSEWKIDVTNSLDHSDVRQWGMVGLTSSLVDGPFSPTIPVATRLSVGNHNLGTYPVGTANILRGVNAVSPASTGAVFSCYYRPVSSNKNYFALRDVTNETYPVLLTVQNSLSGATLSSTTVTFGGQGNASNAGAYVVPLKDNWYRVVLYGSSAAFAPSCTEVSGYPAFFSVYGGYSVGATADVWGVQMEFSGRTWAGPLVETIGVPKSRTSFKFDYLEGDQMLNFNTGGTGEKILSATHMWLRKPIVLDEEMDFFMVCRKTSDSYGTGLFVHSSDRVRGHKGTYGSVMKMRSYNIIDRTAAYQDPLAGYYNFKYGLIEGSTTGEVEVKEVLYPYLAGAFIFSPWESGDILGNSIPVGNRRQLSYDPHVSLVDAGRFVVEAARDGESRISALWNGDPATNRSRSTGRRVSKPSSIVIADDTPVQSEGSDTPTVIYDGRVKLASFNTNIRPDPGPAASAPSGGPIGSQAFVNAVLTATGYNGDVHLCEVIVFNRKLSEYERQAVYGYLSVKYSDLETKLPDKYYRSHTSTYEKGTTYWVVESHPNTKNISGLPFGSEFSGLTLANFFGLPNLIYKSAGTVLADGTLLAGDTYGNVGL